jgi:hypothetical protein
MPINNLGNIATRGSLNMGRVALKKLIRPKINPISRPTSGPSRTPPRIAGTCKMVAWPKGVGTAIKPSGVTPNKMAMAPSIPETTILRVVSFTNISPSVIKC